MHSRHFYPLNIRVTSSAVSAFECVKRLPYPLLLDSATVSDRTGRYSFVMADPDYVVRAWGRDVEVTDVRRGTTVREEGRALDIAQRLLDLENEKDGAASPGPAPGASSLPPFQGGIAGYIGYEYGGVLERLPAPRVRDIDIPDVVLGIYPWVIAWDHIDNSVMMIGTHTAASAMDRVCAMLQGASETDALDATRSVPATTTTAAAASSPTIASQVTRTEYERTITRVQEYIRAGDIFQANLSQRFSSVCTRDPWALYRTLRTINPAPFAAYFDFGDATIVSASPERFLHVSDTGSVETRPIKGTRPRGATADEDRANSTELLLSEKDAAEHVMIVDVLRNDISRVCAYGSVKVPALRVLETYPTVHHLVSTVVGQLRPDATAVDLLHACFPGGSITGAPKVRAMEIIAELEPTARNVYCGTIGYVSATGAMDSSIVIRTFTIKDGTAYFSAGGGIVADSVPADEYQETLDKTQALVLALRSE